MTEDQVSKAPGTLSGAFLACNRSCRQSQPSPEQLLPTALMRKPAWLGLRGQGEVTETLLMATLNHILCVPSVSPMKRLSQPGMQRKGVEGSGFQERIWLLCLCAFPELTPKASTLVGRNLLHQWDFHISDPNSSFPRTGPCLRWIEFMCHGLGVHNKHLSLRHSALCSSSCCSYKVALSPGLQVCSPGWLSSVITWNNDHIKHTSI